MTALRWFAFTTEPGREKAALAELGRFAPEVRLPVGVKHVKVGRKASVTRPRTWPLLVGYAFAAFDAPGQLGAVLAFLNRAREENIPHALRRILATPAGLALELRAVNGVSWFEAMDYTGVELPDGETRPLSWEIGDPVILTDGPFGQFPGVVSRIAGERAKVVISLFARLVEVDVSVRDLVRSPHVPVDEKRRRRP